MPKLPKSDTLNKWVIIFSLMGTGGIVGSIGTVFAVGKTKGAEEQRIVQMEGKINKLEEVFVSKEVLYPQLDNIKAALKRVEDKLDTISQKP